MNLEISRQHARALFQAFEDAREFAQEIGLDLKRSHIEIIDGEIYQGREMYLVIFYGKGNGPLSKTPVNDLDDVCVYIDKETGNTAFITQSR